MAQITNKDLDRQTDDKANKSQGQALIDKLSLQEKRRVYYWDHCDPFIELRMRWRASMIRHLFHILPGQRILEIGAGNRKFSKTLAEVTRNECEIVAAVFLNDYEMCGGDEKQGARVKVQLLDSFPGKLKDERFDIVIAHHMLENSTRNHFLSQIKLLIKPGGGLILFEPNPWNPYYRLRHWIQKFLPLKWRRPNNAVSLNRFQLLHVLSEIGYTQINALPFDFLYSPIPRFLLWPAKHLSVVFENTPYLRNLAGALMVWAKRSEQNQNNVAVAGELSEHEMFYNEVSFVLPCHNEEMNIPPLVEGLKRFYGKYIFEIIIVDDNSIDGTYEIAQELSRTDHRIKAIKRFPPNGVGYALRDGLKAAKAKYIVIMDSDFQHIIPEMRDLFDAIAHGADVAVGSRFSRESVLVNYPFTKILANRSFHFIANILFLRRFRDISNNLKIFRREVVDYLEIESSGFSANVETGLKPILAGFKVEEVPISWVNRTVTMGLSTFRIFNAGPSYFKLLIRLYLRHLKNANNTR